MRSTTLNSNLAIGVFDSGLGGVSVLNTISELMPNETLIYYGDSAFAPYGLKSSDEVIERVFSIVDELISMGIKALVIACNTATSVAVTLLREKHDIPILGLEPALKPAIDAGKKNVLVLATEVTIREKKFASLSKKFEDKAVIHKVPASKLVDIVESDNISLETVRFALKDALKTETIKDYDAVVLGCTHFIFAKNEIQSLIPKAEIYDGNIGVTEHLGVLLKKNNLLNTGKKRETVFLSSDEKMIERFKKYAGK